MKKYNLLFKYTIVLFWCIWWLIAFWTDIIGAAAHLKILRASWAPDTNYPFLTQSLQMYNVPAWVPTFFYIGIIILSGASATISSMVILSLRTTTILLCNCSK